MNRYQYNDERIMEMIMKEARVGGAWTWHQDYGYWYGNAVLYPDLVSVFIAVDRATRENGCLQVLEGSHRCGRVAAIPLRSNDGVTDLVRSLVVDERATDLAA